MIRHDIQEDIRNAYRAINMAAVHSTKSPAILHIEQAQDAVKNIADKFSVDLHFGEID
jgi:hypothetical protein